jgi:hypothetical protein
MQAIWAFSYSAEGRSIKRKREIALGINAAIEGSYRLLISAPDLIPRGVAAGTAVGKLALRLHSTKRGPLKASVPAAKTGKWKPPQD